MTRYKVVFKETYMPKPVTRDCFASSKDQVRKFYDLDKDDIEWYLIAEWDDINGTLDKIGL